MFSAAFIFEDGEMADEFRQLERLIESAAQETSGLVGRESWVSPDGKRRNLTYFWRDQASLLAFSQHPKHITAKKKYSGWKDGFRLIISEVINS